MGLFGQYDAVTDLACFLAAQLIEVYPNAKVVLTTREFEK
jgi:hypothetical protein